MIIVTGMPRSGTSLMMRLLFYLDVPICGRAFPKGRIKAYNPNGYYEDMDFMNANFKEIDQTENFAVKVNLRKLIERNVPLNPTDHKVIACFRPYADMAASQMATGYNPSSTLERCDIQNRKWYGLFPSYIGSVPNLQVNIETLKANKVAGVTAIKNFLSGDRDVDRAVSIIEGGD